MGVVKTYVGGIEILLDDRCRVAQYIAKNGSFEPDTLIEFARAVRPGSTVLDIGAYSGLFSILAAKLRARPIAFEPLPQNLEQAKINAKLNGVMIDFVAAAVSNKTGNAKLSYNRGLKYTAGASLTRALTPTGEITVATTTIDALDLEDVSVVKIDVERHEQEVLEGAAATFARERPLLIVEQLNGRHPEVKGYSSHGPYDERNFVLRPVNDYL